MSSLPNDTTSIISNLTKNLTSISHRSKRHDDFLTALDETECLVDTIAYEDRCLYLNTKPSCFEKLELIDYMTILYCWTSSSPVSYYAANIGFSCWTLYMFLMLGVTADKFFCPVLTALAKEMKMTESVAGVTLLAFGNAAPDLLTAFTNPSGDTELMYNELFGGSAFIIAVVGGTIIIYRPFRVEPFKIARHCLFFMLTTMYISYAVNDYMVTIYDCIVIIFIYLFYIGVVFLNQYLDKSAQVVAHTKQPVKTKSPFFGLFDWVSYFTYYFTKNVVEEEEEPEIKKETLFEEFIHEINPVDLEQWKQVGTILRIVIILEVPVVIILKLIIPIVDYSIDRHGWCKLLNILHCIILPQYILLVFKWITVTFYHIPISLVILAVSIIPVCLLSFYTSKEEIPKYHCYFSIGTLLGSMLTIYLVAHEILSVLYVIGEATGLSDSILGITLLSWGNCVDDFVMNFVLAKKGYARMGFFGCFGGSMLNCLAGVGFTFILKLSVSGDTIAFGRAGEMGPNCTIFLFLLLIFILLAFIMTNFWARRVIGIYMICLYSIFTLFCILNEFGIVHPLGTDHSDQLHIWFGELLSKKSLNKLGYN